MMKIIITRPMINTPVYPSHKQINVFMRRVVREGGGRR
jgi:hypothetical protein